MRFDQLQNKGPLADHIVGVCMHVCSGGDGGGSACVCRVYVCACGAQWLTPGIIPQEPSCLICSHKVPH